MSVDPAIQAANPNVPLRDGNAITWDELFPPDQPAAQGATTPQVGTQTQQVQTPVVQQPAAVTAPPASEFLKTKTGTVYKTADDAIKGIEHKDTVIADMRSRMILATGIDPLTGQPALQPHVAQQRTDYMQDPDRFYSDLVTAAQKNDGRGVYNAQTKLIYDALAPLGPMLSSFAEQQAVTQLKAEIPEAADFVGSQNYQAAVKDTPDLEAAIAQAKSDPQNFHRLPGLYKVAYRVSQGMRLPEILKAQPQQQAAQPVRQTTATQTLTPSTQVSAPPSLLNKEGRAALRAQLEARGIADMPLV